MLLVNLCYLVKSDRDGHFTREEFTELAESLLSERETRYFEEPMLNQDRIKKKYTEPGISPELAEEDDTLISLIYRICSTVSPHKYNKLIKKFHQLFESMGEENGNKLDYDYQLINIFNNFITDITSKHKKLYLVKFEVGSGVIPERQQKSKVDFWSEELRFDERVRYSQRSDDAKQ